MPGWMQATMQQNTMYFHEKETLELYLLSLTWKLIEQQLDLSFLLQHKSKKNVKIKPRADGANRLIKPAK